MVRSLVAVISAFVLLAALASCDAETSSGGGHCEEESLLQLIASSPAKETHKEALVAAGSQSAFQVWKHSGPGSHLDSSVPPGLGPGKTYIDGIIHEQHPAIHFDVAPQAVNEPSQVVGNVVSISRLSQQSFLLTCEGSAQVRLTFFTEDVVRVQLSWNGTFEDAAQDIVVIEPAPDLHVEMSNNSWPCKYVDFVPSGSSGVRLRADTQPLRLSMYQGSQREPVWKEERGLSRNSTATVQTLAAAEDEFFFGGGMQNGFWSHRGHVISIGVSYNWEEGGTPNAAPMYFSSAGYGVFRCTWAEGAYDFVGSPILLAQREQRFDAFYFVSEPRDFKALLDKYTLVTGRPFMPPIYGLGLGDSDCYHDTRHNNDTRVALANAADYRELDIPLGWMLVNDGYGCGYGVGSEAFPSQLDVLKETTSGLANDGIVTGLWSGTDFSNMATEVSSASVRVLKTDVAMVGDGGEVAFHWVKQAASGITNNSDARAFVWTVEGWAGTQRMAVMWTGDNYGNLDYIRWQVPTFVGAGFSAQAHVSGDIDGIFGGSAESQVRDLQWKCFMTVLMTMSGWSTATNDKQPFVWGEPYTSINRMYLTLKMRLTPYFYTLSRIAHETGVPPLRAMLMEFPSDELLYAPSVGSGQQFMAGPSFLVAPVYEPLKKTQVRDGIYLPAGQWVDYWTDKLWSGPQTMSYEAPLETLPVFVRLGSSIPMWPPMRYPGQRAADPLTLDVFPGGESSFELYEDDGVTRAFERREFAKTKITCSAPQDAMSRGGNIKVTIEPSTGSFVGQAETRTFLVQMHVPFAPRQVIMNTAQSSETLQVFYSRTALKRFPKGWMFNRWYGWVEPHFYYTYKSAPYRFRTENKPCTEENCPPWFRTLLIIKVPADVRIGFSLQFEVPRIETAFTQLEPGRTCADAEVLHEVKAGKEECRRICFEDTACKAFSLLNETCTTMARCIPGPCTSIPCSSSTAVAYLRLSGS